MLSRKKYLGRERERERERKKERERELIQNEETFFRMKA
jgi:hypothetical protein